MNYEKPKSYSLKSSEINVEPFKSVVQLSGFVSTQADIDKVVEVASGVSGVKSVINAQHLFILALHYFQIEHDS